ncbi:IreB family regulatory phosphoprotein [Desulfosporosinus sp. SYSU MS00001]|uniref:IreB family regulatory phosphoprotein n=1 Tax=Desulfosporosinus sp. SYSU MS00001 TaxID=3416284 RepID=UPI003CFA366A
MDRMEETMMFKAVGEDVSAREVLQKVYAALQEKGYDPINQMVGYLMSGDPVYITSHNQARAMIRKLERFELIEELVKSYLQEK